METDKQRNTTRRKKTGVSRSGRRKKRRDERSRRMDGGRREGGGWEGKRGRHGPTPSTEPSLYSFLRPRDGAKLLDVRRLIRAHQSPSLPRSLPRFLPPYGYDDDGREGRDRRREIDRRQGRPGGEAHLLTPGSRSSLRIPSISWRFPWKGTSFSGPTFCKGPLVKRRKRRSIND